MKEISLENLIPQKSTFKLQKFPDFEFNLEPCTAGKMIDIGHKFGDVEKLLSIPSAENVSKLALSLMEYNSAVKFKKQNVKTIDAVTGEESEADIGGFLLMAHCLNGMAEQFDVYRAILESIGYGKDQAKNTIDKLKDGINKMVDHSLNEDKKVKKKKRKKA